MHRGQGRRLRQGSGRNEDAGAEPPLSGVPSYPNMPTCGLCVAPRPHGPATDRRARPVPSRMPGPCSPPPLPHCPYGRPRGDAPHPCAAAGGQALVGG